MVRIGEHRPMIKQWKGNTIGIIWIEVVSVLWTGGTTNQKQQGNKGDC